MVKGLSGGYNIGCQERVNKYNFAYIVSEVWGLPFNIHPTLYSPKPGEASRPLDVSLDCDKITNAGFVIPKLEDDLIAMRDDPAEHRRLFQ
mgnify:CR=1 FL=1